MEKLPFHLVPGRRCQRQVPYMTSMVGGQCDNGDDNGAWKKTHQPLFEGLMHYVWIFLIVYIVALLLAPHQVLTTTVVAATAAYNLLSSISIPS